VWGYLRLRCRNKFADHGSTLSFAGTRRRVAGTQNERRFFGAYQGLPALRAGAPGDPYFARWGR